MSYSQAWLEDSNNPRIVLVECKVYSIPLAQNISVYFSNKGYLTRDGNTYFEPIITGSVSINERLRAGSAVSMSFGDIALANHSGVLDEYLGADYVWTNREIKVYFGDPRWAALDIEEIRAEAQFKLVFSGVVADIGSSGKDTLNLKIRNKLEKLNTPVTEDKIGTYGVWPGGQQNQDQVSPLVFGEVHNLTPILIDPSTLEYKFNSNLSNSAQGNTEELIEVRDNGVPITTYTKNLTNGTFKLQYPAAGTITCSVQGIKNAVNLSTGEDTLGYENNLVKIIANIAKNYGSNPVNRLAVDELDLEQLNNFSSQSAPIGLAVLQRENVLITIQRIADSVGAQIYSSREGKLQLLRYGDPDNSVANTTTTITSDDIIFNSLSLAERPPVVASNKIGYGRNWTAQQGLLTLIPEAQKEAFAIEWLTTTVTNNTVKSLYRLEADPGQEDTLLIRKVDAEAEATRRNDLVSKQRAIFRMTCKSRLLSLKLGQEVTIYYPRFGLSSGIKCQVVGLIPDWVSQTVGLELLTIEMPSRIVNLTTLTASQNNVSDTGIVSITSTWPLINTTYYETYSVSATSSATLLGQVHKVLSIPLEVGDTIEISTVPGWPATMPSVSTTGDTYLRLKGPEPSTSDVASSDDHTGNKAYISYTAVTAGLYSIWSGAYGSGSASGTYGWRITRPIINLVGSNSTQSNTSEYYVDPSTVTVSLSAAVCIQSAASLELVETTIFREEFDQATGDLLGKTPNVGGTTWFGTNTGAYSVQVTSGYSILNSTTQWAEVYSSFTSNGSTNYRVLFDVTTAGVSTGHTRADVGLTLYNVGQPTLEGSSSYPIYLFVAASYDGDSISVGAKAIDYVGGGTPYLTASYIPAVSTDISIELIVEGTSITFKVDGVVIDTLSIPNNIPLPNQAAIYFQGSSMGVANHPKVNRIEILQG